MWRTNLFFAFFAILISSNVWAENGGLVGKCSAPTSTDIPRIAISAARTGQTIVAPYRGVDKVEVLIENKNPYKFRYRTTFSQGPLASIIVTDFFSPMLGFLEFFEGFTDAGPSATAAGISREDSDVLRQDISTLRNEIASLNVNVYAYNSFVTVLGADVIDCVRVTGMAVELEDHLEGLLDLSMLRARVDELTGQADVEENEAAVHDMSVLSAALAAIEEKREDFENLQRRLGEVQAGGQPFFELVEVNRVGSTTSTSVEIYRTNLLEQGSAEELIGSITVDMGTVSLSISAGIGISTVDDVKIVRQSASDGMGGVTNKFGFENNSSFSPAGVLMLNGHVVTKENYTFGPSVGLIISQSGDETELEYILGLSFGLRDNLIWLTGGLHAARVESLSGFSIGDKVPESLPDPIPVEESFDTGFIFAITFNIR